MKKALILHGMPSKKEYELKESDSPSNAHWLPWVQKQLLLIGYVTQTPEFPEPYLPQYEKWVEVFEQYIIDRETILIGHSCGAGFLLRYLSENHIHCDKLILVAPWIDPGKEELDNGFFDFTIDKSITNRINKLIIFISSDDDQVIIQSVEIIKERLQNHKSYDFDNKGHFCLNDLGTREFPELIESIIQL